MGKIIKLYGGDSRELFHDVISEFGGDVIVVSDPPFNIGYKYSTYKDKMDESDYLEMLGMFFNDFPSVVIHYPETLYKLAFKIGKVPERVISWVYNSNTPKQHRDIAFFGVRPDMTKVRQPYKNLNDKRIQQRFNNGCADAKLYDWWEINQVKNVNKEKTAHPCQMPIEVMERIVGILPDDCVIVDPFMGSGTTGIAVKNMNELQNANRGFIGIEIDPDYFDIAQARINNERLVMSKCSPIKYSLFKKIDEDMK